MDKNTHREYHVVSLSQCFPTPLLAHLALLSQGNHRGHKGNHGLQIPRQLFDNLGNFGVWSIPLLHTGLGGCDLCPLLQCHMLGLGLLGRTPRHRQEALWIDRTGICRVKLWSPFPLVQMG